MSLSVSEPSLVGSVVASPPVKVLMVSVSVSSNIKASSSNVSDISSISSEPSHLLKESISEVSGSSSVTIMSGVVSIVLDREDQVSVSNRSNGSGSPVEDPPLSLIVWVVVLDSKSVVSVSNVFVPSSSSVSTQSSLDLESDSISEWVSWEMNSSSVEGPGLVGTIVASPENNVSKVVISVSMDIKAFS